MKTWTIRKYGTGHETVKAERAFVDRGTLFLCDEYGSDIVVAIASGCWQECRLETDETDE